MRMIVGLDHPAHGTGRAWVAKVIETTVLGAVSRHTHTNPEGTSR